MCSCCVRLIQLAAVSDALRFFGSTNTMLRTSYIFYAIMSQPSHQKWNYFVLNINIESAPTPPSPEEASKKLKGTLSPSFIQNQFPEEYKEVRQDEPMEVQLQKNLDRLGSQGWELINISTIGPKLLFFFKRLDKHIAGEG